MGAREVVLHIVQELVNTPDRVIVIENCGEQSSIFTINVEPGEVGQVIGKKGVHADAIRRLLTAIGGKQRRNFTLDIVEER